MDWSPSRHQNLLLGHQIIYDTINKKLWDIYIDQEKVVAYDFPGQHWDFIFPVGPSACHQSSGMPINSFLPQILLCI